MYSPDERRSIRNEMNRDAAPSASEAKAEARKHLREKGCKHCDENDPDKLDRVGILTPDCPAMQSPPNPFYIACEECASDRPDSYREMALTKSEDAGNALAVIYECGCVESIDAIPHPRSPESVAITPTHRCGAHIDDIVYFEESDG